MTTRLRGVVGVEQIATGSKSEQTAVVLHTDERTWILRRADGPRFGIDDDLAAWSGRTVEVVGEAGTGTFLVTEPVTLWRS